MRIFRFLIFIILLLFPFGQLTKIPLGIPGVSLYLQDLVIGLLVAWWIIYHLLKKKPFSTPPLTVPALAFIGVALFSLLVNSPQSKLSDLIIPFLYLLRWSAYAGIYFVVYEITRYTLHVTRYKLLRLLALVGIMIAIFGLLQYFLYPNLRNLYYLGWDPHQYRVFGTFLDPGFTGIILVLTFILLLTVGNKCFSHPELDSGSRLLVFLSLLLTYSRSSYLALVVAMVVLAWLKKSPKLLLVPLLLLVFTLGFLPRPAGEGVKLERVSTILGRFENWQQTFEIIRDHPLFGVGFNRLRFVKRDYGFLGKDWQEVHSGAGADSSLLFVWVTTGALGLVVYLWLWWRVVQCSILSTPGESFGHSRSVVASVVASIAALFTHSLFLNSLFYPWVMVWMWVLLGVAHSQFSAKR